MSGYLITGGAGFIGSHIARRLARDGHTVKVFDNLSTGKRENLEEVAGDVELIEADLRDLEALRGAMRGIDYVFHEAALASVPRSIADPVSTNEVNIGGTLNVLIASREANVARVVFASSSSVYGDQEGDAKHENMIASPLSPYAVSKYVGELYGTVFHDLHGLPFVGIRYFNVFGPNQAEDSDYSAVIPIFCHRLLHGKRPVIYGDGRQTRDFTYVDNVVEANLLATQKDAAVGKILNVACGGSYDLNYLVDCLNESLGTDLAPEYADPRAGDVMHSKADIDRARHALDYEPDIGFEEGLQVTARWYANKASGAAASGRS